MVFIGIGTHLSNDIQYYLTGGKRMDLSKYFEETKGFGVLATADEKGHVDVAVYSRPHIFDEKTAAFIMADRLTHHNLQSNPNAAYLFRENEPGYKGIRLFLSKIREEKDSELLYSIRRRHYASPEGEEEETRFLVFFAIDKTLPLIGAEHIHRGERQ
jgi:hypothetical protein